MIGRVCWPCSGGAVFGMTRWGLFSDNVYWSGLGVCAATFCWAWWGGLAMFLGLVQEVVVLGSMLLAKAGLFFFMVG